MNIQAIEVLKSTETSLVKINLRNDGIVEIKFKLDTYEVDVVDQNEIESAFVELTENSNSAHHILVIPGRYGGITKEAREKEMFEFKSFKDQKSINIVVRSLINRLLGTAYFKVKKHKPKYPFKLFNSEEKAIEWIRELQNKKNG